ncbi:MAG TPA: hypothetical protein VKR58_11460 [Aquella sp.]|nr:hypothetical protein [Aquella sp.]
MKNTKKEIDKKKTYTKRELDQLEKKIPRLARVATQEARTNALKRGSSLTEVKAGMLIKVFPSGTRTEIKKIEPSRRVVSNSTFHIKLK